MLSQDSDHTLQPQLQCLEIKKRATSIRHFCGKKYPHSFKKERSNDLTIFDIWRLESSLLHFQTLRQRRPQNHIVDAGVHQEAWANDLSLTRFVY